MSWRDAEWMAALRPVLAVMVFIGAALFFSSIFFRARGAPPVVSINPRHWIPIWKTRQWFRPPGYALSVIGITLFGIGAIALTIVGWFR